MATAMAMAMATGDDPVRQLIEMGEGACLIGEGIKVAGGRGRPVGLIGVGAAPLVGVAKPRTAPLTSGTGRGGAGQNGAEQHSAERSEQQRAEQRRAESVDVPSFRGQAVHILFRAHLLSQYNILSPSPNYRERGWELPLQPAAPRRTTPVPHCTFVPPYSAHCDDNHTVRAGKGRDNNNHPHPHPHPQWAPVFELAPPNIGPDSSCRWLH